jgi:hypothetical protein
MQRNWSKYNESLVKRGEFYLSLDFLSNWRRELNRMNRNKRGRPYAYTDSFIKFTAFLKTAFGLEYRQTEGVLRALSKYIPGVKAADYTTLWVRFARMKFELPEALEDPERVVAFDGTGVKASHRSEWYQIISGKKRKWIKVMIAIDVRTGEILDVVVAEGAARDNALFKEKARKIKMKAMLADGAFDDKEIFDYCDENNIQPIIKIRKGASPKSRGSRLRRKCIRELEKIGQEAWNEKYDYGKRWLVESCFSAVKRAYGEGVSAKRVDMAKKEAMLKFILYSAVKNSC